MAAYGRFPVEDNGPEVKRITIRFGDPDDETMPVVIFRPSAEARYMWVDWSFTPNGAVLVWGSNLPRNWTGLLGGVSPHIVCELRPDQFRQMEIFAMPKESRRAVYASIDAVKRECVAW